MITMTEDARKAIEYTFSHYPAKKFRIHINRKTFILQMSSTDHDEVLKTDDIFIVGGYVFAVESGLMERVGDIRIEAAGNMPLVLPRRAICMERDLPKPPDHRR